MSRKWESQFQEAFDTVAATPPDELTSEEKGVEYLPIETVQTNEAVFQPRNLRDADTKAGSDAQIKRLVERLENGETLDKIAVWKWKGQWWCVDGWHRLMAYRQWQRNGRGKAGRQRSRLPVRVMTGTLKEVRGKADKENFKTKFNVPFADQSNAAWEWVKRGEEVAWIMTHTGASRSLVYSMKATLKRLTQERSDEIWKGLRWEAVGKWLTDPCGGRKDERRMHIQQFKQGILKGCAHRPKRFPEEFMEAVCEVYPEREGAFRDWLNARHKKKLRQENPFDEGPIVEI